MKRLLSLVPLLLLAVVFLPADAPSQAQQPAAAQAPPHVVVSLYRIAPGKQLDFLKWMASNEALDKEAGVPLVQVYAHTNGDSWDYMVIAPDLSEAQQAKVDQVAKSHGRKVGFAGGLEFREHMAWHTDTFAIGPVAASQLVAMAND